MSTVLDMICETLPPTATHAHRSFVWIPASEREVREDGRDGTLRIDMRRGKRHGSKTESDTYAVQRIDQQGSNRMGFLLVNLTDAEQDQPYECRPAGAVHPATVHCTCTAGRCKVPTCKHRDALALIIEIGGL